MWAVINYVIVSVRHSLRVWSYYGYKLRKYGVTGSRVCESHYTTITAKWFIALPFCTQTNRTWVVPSNFCDSPLASPSGEHYPLPTPWMKKLVRPPHPNPTKWKFGTPPPDVKLVPLPLICCHPTPPYLLCTPTPWSLVIPPRTPHQISTCK